MRTVMAIMVENRRETAEKVQKLLTGWGCLIKMRLGLHDQVLDNCSDEGLLILELVGDPEKHEELSRKLNVLPGVVSKLMKLTFEK